VVSAETVVTVVVETEGVVVAGDVEAVTVMIIRLTGPEVLTMAAVSGASAFEAWGWLRASRIPTGTKIASNRAKIQTRIPNTEPQHALWYTFARAVALCGRTGSAAVLVSGSITYIGYIGLVPTLLKLFSSGILCDRYPGGAIGSHIDSPGSWWNRDCKRSESDQLWR
jgi:hypothetical protein